MSFQLPATPKPITEAEYLDYCDQHPEYRFELINGEIIERTGASRNHNLITVNLVCLLKQHLLDNGCFVFMSQWLIKVEHNFYYPDVIIECHSEHSQPKLIVEVLSELTRSIDLSTKLNDYQKIPTLQEYMLVEQNARFIILNRRSQNWQAEVCQGDEVFLTSLNTSILLDDIYQKVVFKNRKLIINTP